MLETVDGPRLESGDDEGALVAAIDHLIAGRYLSVPEGQGAVGRKLHDLARRLQAQAQAEVRRAVEMSVNTCEAVTGTAEMMRAIREMDERTQAIASASEEMVATVHDISANSDQVAAEAEQARTAANSVGDAARNAVSSMEDISRAVEEAAGRVENLAEASTKIGEIVEQIEAIAKQTNLLALNATIEAARAGEAGKGFAVVAGEVKNLASQTARATVDIRTRIEGLRTDMAAIVESMEKGAKAVEQGRAVITHTGDGIHDVVDRIEAVTAKTHDIAAILGQQTEASTEISQGIAKIAEMSALDVKGVEEVLDVMDRSTELVSTAINDLGAQEIEGFTILAAKSDHMLWRKQLAQMMAGRLHLDARELADHNACRLGKWYNAVRDPAIRDHPAFTRLAEPHRQVHAAGIAAVDRYNAGDLDGALQYIEKAAEASAHVVKVLDELAAG